MKDRLNEIAISSRLVKDLGNKRCPIHYENGEMIIPIVTNDLRRIKTRMYELANRFKKAYPTLSIADFIFDKKVIFIFK